MVSSCVSQSFVICRNEEGAWGITVLIIIELKRLTVCRAAWIREQQHHHQEGYHSENERFGFSVHDLNGLPQICRWKCRPSRRVLKLRGGGELVQLLITESVKTFKANQQTDKRTKACVRLLFRLSVRQEGSVRDKIQRRDNQCLGHQHTKGSIPFLSLTRNQFLIHTHRC